MTQPFRIMAPKRTCTKNRANYNNTLLILM